MWNSSFEFVLLPVLLAYYCCSSASAESNQFWKQNFDRVIMNDEILPEIGRVVGSDGKVLEIGFEPYNRDDSSRASLRADQLFFNEIRPINEKTINLLPGVMSDLPENPKLRHSFDVVYDYGVLGHTPNWWRNETLNMHIEAYGKLLKNNGFAYIKVDLHWPDTNFIWWPKIRNNLALHLEPVSSDCRSTMSCAGWFRKKITDLDNGFTYVKGSTASTPNSRGGCSAYCFTKWRYFEDYKPSGDNANWTTFTDWKSLPGYGFRKRTPNDPYFIN
jgi:hypothetical protein